MITRRQFITGITAFAITVGLIKPTRAAFIAKYNRNITPVIASEGDIDPFSVSLEGVRKNVDCYMNFAAYRKR